MSLVNGTRLGPYEILSPLGAGGMGEVYRARDTRLDRTVAIKVISGHLSEKPQLRERFEREARAVSRLNHPHICTLYDVGQHEGADYLVMEYLEGETLAHRLAKGPLPLDQVLSYAVEIADALAQAHRQGVIHRDLKPGNIMLTRAGSKVLDFGLAKVHALESAPGLTQHTNTLTEEGTLVGTLQYMAPEQLEGKEADARSDIFAFGAMVYEMAAARKAFEGKSKASLIAAILEHEPPPLMSLQPVAPPALDHVVRVCMAKDPEERWQTAGDLKRELKWITESGSQVTSEPVAAARARQTGNRTAAAVTIAALVVLATGGAYWFFKGRANPASSHIALGRTTQITVDPGLTLDPVISPDGKLIAYAAGTTSQAHIYVRQLGATRSIKLTEGMPGHHRWPQWSPDGSRILFSTVDLRTLVRTISTVPALGGASKRLIEKKDATLRAPVWSPDGTRIAYASGSDVYVLSLDGTPAVKIAEHPVDTHSLAWSQDGARIAYVVGNGNFVFGVGALANIAPSSIWVVPAAGGKAVQVTDRVHLNMSPVWTRDSQRLLFISNRGGRRDLYELALRASDEPAGTPALLTAGLNALTISLSNDGTKLAYTVLNHEANIWSIPIPTRPPVSVSTATSVTTGNQAIEGITLSPDQKWLAFDSNRSGNQDIFRMPLAGGEIEQLTTSLGDDFLPSWSPDGKEIAFYSWRSGSRDLYLMSVDGSAERQLTSDPGQEFYPDWSPDGKHLVFLSIQSGKNALALITRSADGASWGTTKELAVPGGYARWSPDGRLIAYVFTDLRVVSPEGGEPRILVESKDPGVFPRPAFAIWSKDSRTVYYKAYDAEQRSSIWSVPAVGGTPTLLVKFDDPARQSPRVEFATDGKQFFFTVGHYQSDIFVMDVQKQL